MLSLMVSLGMVVVQATGQDVVQDLSGPERSCTAYLSANDGRGSLAFIRLSTGGYVVRVTHAGGDTPPSATVVRLGGERSTLERWGDGQAWVAEFDDTNPAVGRLSLSGALELIYEGASGQLESATMTLTEDEREEWSACYLTLLGYDRWDH